ncbi:tetratricopeptide repeat protein [Planotetraspora kaengkrachanensis]|uniref:ATP/GTP-binding protein n=1 Tax=Planotetraspora kaengkrachanensis TaxID=575193 RepID=A0A8J3M6Y6_9ACTN|nr:tetratricopeptide repeat protein [Planotetraspora kaengkrachanensis]GIG80575.1 ATP/GTP-binding protein [Planotetraspora kaengkrachanensis]
MDLVTAAGAVVGVAALGVGVWQLRVAIMDRRDAHARSSVLADSNTDSAAEGALPVAVPVGRLPPEVLGRDDMLAELTRALGRRKRNPGAWVLAGMGGVGKSTVALWLAAEARKRGWKVWWVSAADALSLRGGIVEILRQAGAPEAIKREVREGAPTAADRFWAFVDAGSMRRSLLIFDNADLPSVLSADGVSLPADGTGWVRHDASIVCVVTTRVGDPRIWGGGARIRPLKVLDDVAAAAVLRALAPAVADRTGQEAVGLARRLGALPLALHLAGTYLASPFARWRGFDDYRRALDSGAAPEAVADLDSAGSGPRAMVSRTWELSLDSLADQGLGQARRLLYLLSCFASATPIPASILRPEADRDRRAFTAALRGLAELGLIDLGSVSDAEYPEVVVHPVIADTCRARLLVNAEPDNAAIMRTAVRLAQSAGEELDYWPFWERLIPHVRALLAWIAPHLDEAALKGLLSAGQEAFSSLWLTGSRASAEGEDLARAILAAAERLGREHPATLAARHQLGISLYNRGRAGEAEKVFRIVLAGRCRVLGEDDTDTLLTRDQLIGAILAQGRYREAEQMYRELIVDMERALGPDHRETLTTRIDLAWSIGMQGRADEAAEICRVTLAADRRLLGAEHSRTLDAWADLARWTYENGSHGEAEQMARELVDIERRVLGDEHPLTLSTRATLARSIASQGLLTEAELMLRDVLAVMERTIGNGDFRAITARRYLADTMSGQGHARQAELIYRDVLELQQRWLGPEHPETLATKALLTSPTATL